MSFHSRSRRHVRGSISCDEVSPRICVSLPPDDMRRLAVWAAKHGKPVAWALRQAVHSYLARKSAP